MNRPHLKRDWLWMILLYIWVAILSTGTGIIIGLAVGRELIR